MTLEDNRELTLNMITEHPSQIGFVVKRYLLAAWRWMSSECDMKCSYDRAEYLTSRLCPALCLG